MFNFKTLVSIFLLASCVMFSAQSIAAPQAYNITDPKRTLNISEKYPEFSITLRSNPTTGYSWFMKKYNPHFITVVKHVYHPPISQLVGAGGVDVWTFRLTPAAFTVPHKLKMKMIYARPWEMEKGGKTVEFTIASY